ncbi:MAG: N-acetylmuramidase domain-containing protein [Pseudomonadota bacterium]
MSQLPDRVPFDAYVTIGDALRADPFMFQGLSVVESAERPDAIRFENHWWRKTRFASREAKRFDRKRNHRDWEKRWAQFEEMDRIAHDDSFLNARADKAAIYSHSFGFCQIMGFNHRHCGFEDHREWLAAMKTMDGQVQCLIGFIQDNQVLHDAFRNASFDAIGHHYNGPQYRRHKYHVKLARAVTKSQRQHYA